MIHGIINVYKEKGFTSHDVVAKLRGNRSDKRRSDIQGHLIRMRQVSFRCVLEKQPSFVIF